MALFSRSPHSAPAAPASAENDTPAGLRSSLAGTTRKATNAAFAVWARDFIAAHPEVEGFYNRVIRPDVEPSSYAAAVAPTTGVTAA